MKTIIPFGVTLEHQHACINLRCAIDPTVALDIQVQYPKLYIEFKQYTKRFAIIGFMDMDSYGAFKLTLDIAMEEYKLETQRLRLNILTQRDNQHTRAELQKMSGYKIREEYDFMLNVLDNRALATITADTIASEKSLCDNPGIDGGSTWEDGCDPLPF